MFSYREWICNQDGLNVEDDDSTAESLHPAELKFSGRRCGSTLRLDGRNPHLPLIF
jgi:hypothetical protein